MTAPAELWRCRDCPRRFHSHATHGTAPDFFAHTFVCWACGTEPPRDPGQAREDRVAQMFKEDK